MGAFNVVETRVANVIHGSDRHTPISDHFLEILGKVSQSEDIERRFERLEVLLALHYLNAAPENAKYTLRGRFVWNHSSQVIQRVQQEIEREGDQWPPLGVGLFGGTTASAASLVESLLENVRVMDHRYW